MSKDKILKQKRNSLLLVVIVFSIVSLYGFVMITLDYFKDIDNDMNYTKLITGNIIQREDGLVVVKYKVNQNYYIFKFKTSKKVLYQVGENIQLRYNTKDFKKVILNKKQIDGFVIFNFVFFLALTSFFAHLLYESYKDLNVLTDIIWIGIKSDNDA